MAEFDFNYLRTSFVMLDHKKEFDLNIGMLLLIVFILFSEVGIVSAITWWYQLSERDCISRTEETRKAEMRFYYVHGYYTKSGLWPYMDRFSRISDDSRIEKYFQNTCNSDWSMENNIDIQNGSYTITANTRKLIYGFDIIANESGIYINNRRMKNVKVR